MAAAAENQDHSRFWFNYNCVSFHFYSTYRDSTKTRVVNMVQSDLGGDATQDAGRLRVAEQSHRFFHRPGQCPQVQYRIRQAAIFGTLERW